ncbi:biopolymer transporter ExbD [Phormidesmis priestleyi ULC007]|uniref:Biopolymer transporter ExbD n=1 Tax=Phormidesmis priestleyi ULC007 TaxID=1920490 RepID=A0A2T1DMM4_9CYAN|nr:biopolymer transporter ExbD [Phormidesmis priestleyi]PSB21757.1 biopolymer transporter ExbD [Phormidesmis priestleyi ULC007]PZO50863.1 MAG: biopolymer transporter ExbD [Phormidesmis priestleyi]
MKINLDASQDEAQIQIIPLIDVIFCILTFFILAALQLTRREGINLDLPTASTGTPQNQEMLVVNIDSTGLTSVKNQPVDRVQLYQVLQNYHQQNPQGLLVLSASQTSFYNDVIQVLDVLRAVGGDRVALETAPQTSPSPNQNPAIPGQTPLNPGLTTPAPSIDPLNPQPSLNPISPTSPNLQPTNPSQVPTGQSPVSPQQSTPTVPSIPPQ